jgi:hypothetical protein
MTQQLPSALPWIFWLPAILSQRIHAFTKAVIALHDFKHIVSLSRTLFRTKTWIINVTKIIEQNFWF